MAEETVEMEKPGGGTTQVPESQAESFEESGYEPTSSEAEEAASPEELTSTMESNEILTEEIRARISDVTKPSRATQSI